METFSFRHLRGTVHLALGGPSGGLQGWSSQPALLGSRGQEDWGSQPCPVHSPWGRTGGSKEFALVTEGTEALAVLELALSTHPVPQCQHSSGTLNREGFFGAMLGAEKLRWHFGSEKEALCEKQGDKNGWSQERRSKDPITTGLPFTHLLIK